MGRNSSRHFIIKKKTFTFPVSCLASISLKGRCNKIFLLQVFFHESSSPKPLKITLGLFQNFSKICWDIGKSKCTGTSGVIDTGGKPVSKTPAVNLSKTLVAKKQQYKTTYTLKWTWRKKCIYLLTLLPKGIQTK